MEGHLVWPNEKHRKLGKVTSTRGDEHDHSGMTVMFKDGDVTIDTTKHVNEMAKEFPMKFCDNDVNMDYEKRRYK